MFNKITLANLNRENRDKTLIKYISTFKNNELSAVHDSYVTLEGFVRDPNIKMKNQIHEFEKIYTRRTPAGIVLSK